MALPCPLNQRLSPAASYQTPGACGLAPAASRNGLQGSTIALHSVISPFNEKVSCFNETYSFRVICCLPCIHTGNSQGSSLSDRLYIQSTDFLWVQRLKENCTHHPASCSGTLWLGKPEVVEKWVGGLRCPNFRSTNDKPVTLSKAFKIALSLIFLKSRVGSTFTELSWGVNDYQKAICKLQKYKQNPPKESKL